MNPSIIYYSPAFAPWKETLNSFLKDTKYEHQWRPFQALSEVPVSSMTILHESDLGETDIPYVGARKVLLLVSAWSFKRSLQMIEIGANDCIGYDDISRIATWVIAEISRSAWQSHSLDQPSSLQTVLDAIPVPIFYKDEHHIYRGCNQSFSEFIGLAKESVIGHSVYDIAPKELADVYYEADQALLAAGGTQVYEASAKSASGELMEIEFSKAVFYKANGEKGGQVGAMLNITDRNRLMRQLDKASRTDPLTGVGNRREFNIAVSVALQKARQSLRATSLLTIDVDHFKSVNDVYGHSGGDKALKFLVNSMLEALPEGGQVYRIGGEEFYILLPDNDLAEARVIAENIRRHIPEQTLSLRGGNLSMTVSIGVIQLGSEQQLEESFKRVDQALYEAKSLGRNRVCLAYYD
ncbi:GGDEF domain-containing protein [Marinomonas ostreistagni]|uniref:diguanylate cyclase n=1 Tax=Marinomonas ostreistagni TaxID=359209 RepID=A0ABS0ZE72_9GAMM|nr:GGDEF domain-containing protein [Marinomonas ostreistagni]MBJ7551226.1 diguanylate cyclase [Marinomonas ostreistagni]